MENYNAFQTQLKKYKPDFVGFEDTKKECISGPFLNSVVGSVCYSWHVLPAIGIAGELLVGLNEHVFEFIGSI